MSSEERIAVDCPGCGQEYQVPPPDEDQRAKCRRCGRQFVIAATAIGRRVKKPRHSRYQAAVDRLASASIASRAAQLRRTSGPRERQRGSGWIWWRLVAPVSILVIAGVVAVFLTGQPEAVDDAAAREILHRGRVARLSAPSTKDEYRTIADLVEAIEPSVVQVETSRGVGSGFVLDPAGLIVTCEHCVADVRFARVVFADKRELPVIGVRAMRQGHDLAILQVQTDKPLPALALAGKPPRKGDPVVVFGSPAGLSFSVSEGSVSALRKVGEVENITGRMRAESRLALSPSCELVQFSGSSMPGNSGGPVVDYRGNVVGITSFTLHYHARRYEFAIAFQNIRELSQHLDDAAMPLWAIRQGEDDPFAEFFPD